jgi:L-seryl-tRNA(Ser) seleniumtransferase
MLSASVEEVRGRAQALAARIQGAAPSLTLAIVEGTSAAGGGAAPTAEIPTALLRVAHGVKSAQQLVEELRRGDPPVVARIDDGALVLDLRTVATDEEDVLAAALLRVATAHG